MSARGCGILTQQLQGLLHMPHILLTGFDRLCVVLQVIIAVRQTESALVNLGYNFGSVVEILSGGEAKQGSRRSGI